MFYSGFARNAAAIQHRKEDFAIGYRYMKTNHGSAAVFYSCSILEYTIEQEILELN